MPIVLLSSALMLAATALPAADVVALDTAIAGVYRPYAKAVNETASWDYPIYSREAATLIAHWQRAALDDEPDALNDGDWLCMCQDFDAKAFRVIPRSHMPLGGDAAEVAIRIELGWNQFRDARMQFRREAGNWRLDDLYGADFPRGLKQKLRETIAEDEAR